RLYANNQIHAPPVVGVFNGVFGLVYFEDGIIDQAHLRIYIPQDIRDITHPDNLATIIHELVEANQRLHGDSIEIAHQKAEVIDSQFRMHKNYTETEKGGIQLILLSGPSAVGKGPLWEQLKRRFPDYFERIILYTSRAKGPDEIDEVTYHFRTAAKILQLHRENPDTFITMDVHGDIQGLDLKDVDQAIKSGKIAFAEVSVDWAAKLRDLYGKRIYSIFMAPLSEKEIADRAEKNQQTADEVIYAEMLERQNERNQERPAPEAKRIKRATNAVKEVARKVEYDTIIVNTDLHDIKAHQERWDGREGRELVGRFMAIAIEATTEITRVTSQQTMNFDEYIDARIPVGLISKCRAQQARIEIHLASEEETLKNLGLRGASEVKKINSSKRRMKIISALFEGRETFVFTGIFGKSRLKYLVSMLKYKGISRERMSICDLGLTEETLYSSLLKDKIGNLSAVIFTFDVKPFVDVIKSAAGQDKISNVEFITHDLLRAAIVTLIDARRIAVIDISSVYGEQAGQLIKWLARETERSGCLFERLFFMGTCGSIADVSKINDMIVPEVASNVKGDSFKFSNSLTPADVRSQLEDNIAVNVFDVMTAESIFSESRDQILLWKQRGYGVVDIELAHVIEALRYYPCIEAGVLLEVTDLIGRKLNSLSSWDVANYTDAPRRAARYLIVNQALRRDPAERDPDLVLISHCRLAPMKSLETFIETVAILHNEFTKSGKILKAQIFGGTLDSPYARELIDLVRAKGLEEVISFMGRYDRSNLAGLYRYPIEKYLFLFTSELDTFGLAAAEAMMMGVPVICSNVGGVQEVVSSGEKFMGRGIKAGVVVKAHDTRDVSVKAGRFAGAVLELYRNPKKREILARNAVVIAKKFDYRNSALEHYHALRRLSGKDSFSLYHISLQHFPYNLGGIAEVVKDLVCGFKELFSQGAIGQVGFRVTSAYHQPLKICDAYQESVNQLEYFHTNHVGKDGICRQIPDAETLADVIAPLLETLLGRMNSMRVTSDYRRDFRDPQNTTGEADRELIFKLWSIFQQYDYNHCIESVVSNILGKILPQLTPGQRFYLVGQVFFFHGLNYLKGEIYEGDIIQVESAHRSSLLGLAAKVKGNGANKLVVAEMGYGGRRAFERLGEDSSLDSAVRDFLLKNLIYTSKLIYDNADLCICVSNALKNDLIKDFNLPKDKTIVVHCGINYAQPLAGIRQRLNHPDHMVRFQAIRELCRLESDEAIREMVGVLVNEIKLNNYLVKSALARKLNPYVDELLCGILEDPEVAKRFIGERFLIGGPNFADFAIRMHLFESIAQVFGLRKTVAAEKGLSLIVSDSSHKAYVRKAAAEALGEIGVGFDALFKQVGVRNCFEQDAVISALLKMPSLTRRHMGEIEAMLSVNDEYLQRAAILLIAKLSPSRLKRRIFGIYTQTTSALVQEALIRVLPGLTGLNDGQLAYDILLQKGNPLSVRIEALRSLGNILSPIQSYRLSVSIITDEGEKILLRKEALLLLRTRILSASVFEMKSWCCIAILGQRLKEDKSTLVRVMSARILGEIAKKFDIAQSFPVREILAEAYPGETSRIVRSALIEALDLCNYDITKLPGDKVIDVQGQIARRLDEFLKSVSQIQVMYMKASLARKIFIESSDIDYLFIYHLPMPETELKRAKEAFIELLIDAGIYLKQPPVFEFPEWIEVTESQEIVPVNPDLRSGVFCCYKKGDFGFVDYCNDPGKGDDIRGYAQELRYDKFENRMRMFISLGELNDTELGRILALGDRLNPVLQSWRENILRFKDMRLSGPEALLAMRIHALCTQEILYGFPARLNIHGANAQANLNALVALENKGLIKVFGDRLFCSWIFPQFGFAEIELERDYRLTASLDEADTKLVGAKFAGLSHLRGVPTARTKNGFSVTKYAYDMYL
ncbi:MAG: glycosyltransferase, partial [Candidatus Omnitrophica bacterium]|nr:glycosyltransferase [Candidatus Omnitrophota bacterium]